MTPDQQAAALDGLATNGPAQAYTMGYEAGRAEALDESATTDSGRTFDRHVDDAINTVQGNPDLGDRLDQAPDAAEQAQPRARLGYELQVRWQMHVMDASLCHVVALVAGRGLCHYPITRDLDLEAELVRQVDAWWTRHIIGGEEPTEPLLQT